MCFRSSAPPCLILLALFLVFFSATAFNITKILSQFPDFSTLNNYLTQTQIASEINSRSTITVLVVDNGAISSLSGKPTDMIKKVLSLHVVLDYYDIQKLQHLQNKTTILTTLFQTSGQATGQQGFLNVTAASSTGGVSIASAGQGSGDGASLVKEVVAQPYNVSVVQISNIIVPSGLINSSSTPPSSSPPSPAPHARSAKPPAAAPPKSSRKDAPAAAPAQSHVPSNGSAPSADAPTEAPGPTADSPKGSSPSPVGAKAPIADAAVGASPADDAPVGDAPTDPPSPSTAAKSVIDLPVVRTILFCALCAASII
ncbi:Fasciclin-like arabinogalactan protein 14 [Morella rubra]|uniref:Fasciclin-like arabinogalactan protein 14 n=1 Tax=Morella rubra TaxID=262757 RepID=A0A6A1VSD4_9ROSI|nr:Fasciclin-like arabinogalactan protein 14 [Morella rubra]